MSTKLLNIYTSGTKAHNMAAAVPAKGFNITGDKFKKVCDEGHAFVSVNSLGKAPGVRSISGAERVWADDVKKGHTAANQQRYVFLVLDSKYRTDGRVGVDQRICGKEADVFTYLAQRGYDLRDQSIGNWYLNSVITSSNYNAPGAPQATAFANLRAEYCAFKAGDRVPTESAAVHRQRTANVYQAITGAKPVATADVKFVEKKKTAKAATGTLAAAAKKTQKKSAATPGTPKGKRGPKDLVSTYQRFVANNATRAGEGKKPQVLDMTNYPAKIVREEIGITYGSKQRGNPAYDFVVKIEDAPATNPSMDMNLVALNKYAAAYAAISAVPEWRQRHATATPAQIEADFRADLAKNAPWKGQRVTTPRAAAAPAGVMLAPAGVINWAAGTNAAQVQAQAATMARQVQTPGGFGAAFAALSPQVAERPVVAMPAGLAALKPASLSDDRTPETDVFGQGGAIATARPTVGTPTRSPSRATVASPVKPQRDALARASYRDQGTAGLMQAPARAGQSSPGALPVGQLRPTLPVAAQPSSGSGILNQAF